MKTILSVIIDVSNDAMSKFCDSWDVDEVASGTAFASQVMSQLDLQLEDGRKNTVANT